MRTNDYKSSFQAAVRVAGILLSGAVLAFGQQQINLTAGPATTTLPDGSAVPMWGYSCGLAVGGSTASCAALNPAATSPALWSPVVITVPTGQTLQINLTNNLSFTPTGSSTPNTIPTSLVIVGQLGGGLGSARTTTPSPLHDNQPTTWPIANTGAVFTPPAQGPRVQSLATEVAVGTTATALTWTTPRPGTYLLESGTHPSIQGPMGLYGIVVVTTAPAGGTAGTAYPAVGTTPAVSYNAEVPLLFSEIDAVQNKAVDAAVRTIGFSESATLGTFLGGPVVSINLTNGGLGYTSAPSVTLACPVSTPACGSGGTAHAVIDSDMTSPTYGQITEIDIDNAGTYTSSPLVQISPALSGAAAVAALQLQPNALAHCSGGAAACYPPAVNYTPLYYLINGSGFNKTNATASLYPVAPATGVSGTVLVRLVNAGLRMHIPSIVGSQTGTSASGFSLIAEDGNPLPGVPRVQSEVFMAAGKTYDVMVNVPAAGSTALPIYDRQLSLSGNATERDAGMLAYISVNGAALPSAPAFTAAAANPDSYSVTCITSASCNTLTVSDPGKGVVANDVNVYGVQVAIAPSKGTLALNGNGTFTYVPNGSWTAPDTFTYCGNGATSGAACATVTLGAAAIEANTRILLLPDRYTANALSLKINPPGILANDQDLSGYPLKVAMGAGNAPLPSAGLTLSVDPNGGFRASVAASGTFTFTYRAQNSQGTVSSGNATVTLVFPAPSNLAVTVLDGHDKTTQITDYRWIIEEDRTFYVNPNTTANVGGTTPGSVVPTFGTNFHTSFMPVVATGCTGQLSCEGGQTIVDPTTGNHSGAVCDVGNGVCRPDPSQQGFTTSFPGNVHLDPTKRYYISVLPGDAANPFNAGYAGAPDCSTAGVAAGSCGHGMGGAPIAAGQTSVTILTQPTPFPPAQLSVFVFEDDFPLNGEQDAGGGVDVLASNEPGLGGFQITLFDDAGGTGDSTGQPTYDMFNQPLTNSLAGTIDPVTGADACPISTQDTANATTGDGSQKGIVGMIVTCPKYESDGMTLSPLAGQAVVPNMYQGRYGVVATPGADRIARGEEWLQTNTLDGQKAHDSFMRIGEPSFFQEFGPAGYHVSIGFANPQIINSRLAGVCAGTDLSLPGSKTCNNTVTGLVTTERMSRTPDQRLYGSGSNDSFAFTQCYVSFGDADGEDFAFTKCNADGTFTMSGLPAGDWRVTVFDQWNDMLVDGLSTPVRLGNGATTDLGQIAMSQWQANIYTSTFFDQNGDGVRQDSEPGLTLVATNIRFRDGSFSNFNNTDLAGNAGFNEVFPLFSWYVIETDSTRLKNTGTHVVYDAGGPADGNPCGTAATPPTAPCGNSNIAHLLANTVEQVSVPVNQRVPGAVYCATADCTGKSIAAGPGSSDPPSTCTTSPSTGVTTCSTTLSTGRIDPPWVVSEGWQGFSGQNSFIEFGKKPYAAGENGGIRGHVIYASTRPFDDPYLLLQTSWEPLVPNVTINLYQEGTAPDGTQSLTLVDTTQTSSWDNWAQGFRSDGIPNMNCPGQFGAPTTSAAGDLFFFSLFNQPMYLDFYYNGSAVTPLPNNSQFKCYDGMHNWNQLQPAPYDGMYQFPSVTVINPTTGMPSATGTNCRICISNPDSTDPFRAGMPMLPAGKYVVEVVPPPGYELVKEEDKNILIGDNYIAPVTSQFAGFGNIFILPDQAAVGATYNKNNAQNPTQDLGAFPRHEGDTGSVESFWPCVGQARIVPDFISLFPQSLEVSPFAGAMRNLCDRKEVILEDQSQVLAKFYIFTSTHIAAHFTGVITDDFTSEFDPFSPQFGEKFSPANLPISIKDWTGNEISRVYSDHWGSYNGLTYSTWEVNPPNPTGYGPTTMVTCMNDPGTGATPDPLFNPAYSQFCYEIPFMPGQTQYMDTPVVPTSAFAGAGYNNVDCNYPDGTPAISSVTGSVAGPWVSAAGQTLTLTALGDVSVNNYGYSGPSATTPPFNQKTITRHYGFGTTAGTVALVGSDGVAHPLTSVSWSDATISGAVPGGLPNCAVTQQTQYGGSAAQCGQLVITTAAGKQSIDTVTVTIGGKAPTVLAATQTIQSAIDAASPGDMIIVPPGNYSEILLMWKPIRLQGVGAASSILNANTHPAGKMDPWRRQVNCLFGLALNGQPRSATNPYDSTNTFTCGTTNGVAWSAFDTVHPQVDRIPLEGILGWDVTTNGNLAEMLQEPTLMGAYEGAGITILGKGVVVPGDPFAPGAFGTGAESAFPAGTRLLTSGDCLDSSGNPYPSNFLCNPSSIDGLSITNSSQGGGGIFLHGWGHSLQIANNRVTNNTGTLTGGITVGQGESGDAYLVPDASSPTSCEAAGSSPAGVQLPFCFETNVNVHHNSVTLNSSIGDELFSSTPAGGGGVTFCTGADYYRFQYNWVCGNLSTGDGGGVVHLGFIKNGDIEHNSILLNQSTNPTVPTNGGGLIVMGAPPDGVPNPPQAGVTECGSVTDIDCAPGLPDGSGPGLVINANLFLGNAAESGSGGGIRFQNVNGTEVTRFPGSPDQWYSVSVTNNIIANNVAGWDGAGVALLDSLAVNFVNNTIMSNDTTASSGVLFNTIGAPLASSSGPTCTTSCGTTSQPQPAGLVAIPNSAPLLTALGALPMGTPIVCPTGHPNCAAVSYPLLYNDLFWENRAFYISVGTLGSGPLNQQNVVALYNAFTTTQAATQPTADTTVANGNGSIITGGTGACVLTSATSVPPNIWDIGVRGDTGPSNHASTFTLTPTYSVLTDVTDYPGGNNSGANPTVISQYCNGSRVPPEFKSLGYQVPPGISDATVPNPIFNLTPNATVDEGNNWINISWGPLTLANPITGVTLGNYGPAAASPVIDAGTLTAAGVSAPTTDFYGNARTGNPDIGAVEFRAAGNGTGGTIAPALTSINPSSGLRNTSFPVTLSGTGLTGATAINVVPGAGITVSAITVVNDTTVTATFAIASGTTAALGVHNVSVVTPNGTTNTVPFSVVLPSLTAIFPATGVRGTTVPVTLTGANIPSTGVTFPAVAGITISGVTVVNSTTITANFAIAAGATLGVRNIGINTLSGNSNTVPFTVVARPVPVLTSISPSYGLRNTSLTVTLTGTNLNGATAVTAAGISTTLLTINPTTITATFTITSTAALGPRGVTVTTPGGTSNAVSFTVPAATLSSVAPNTGLRGGPTLSLTFTGGNLTGATSFTASPATGFTLSAPTVVNSTTVTATLTIATTAAAGVHTILINTPEGPSNTVPFTVIVPTATSVTPSSGLRGTTFPVTIVGTNFAAGTTVTVSGTGVTTGPVTVVNSTTLTTSFTIATNATTGARTVTVNVPSAGASNTLPFTVNGAAITAVNPNVAPSGATPVTFTGTNLAGVNAGSVSGTGVTVTGFTAAATSVTATVNVTTAAARGARTISLNGTNGATNTLPFTIEPAISSFTPTSATRGTGTISVPFSIVGVGLMGATGLNGLESGVTFAANTVTDTSITGTLSISSTASAVTLSIGVMTPSGGTNTLPFTVN